MRLDETLQSLAYDNDRVNTVLDRYPALGDAHFICSEPGWLRIVRRGLFLLSGFGLAYFAISPSTITFLAPLLLWLLSVLAIAVAVRPLSGHIRYVSDSQGVYFPSQQRLWRIGPARPKTWLFVPWSNISKVGVQSLLDEWGYTEGVTFCLRASEEERQVYFSETAVPDLDGISPSGHSHRGSILIGYPSPFISPYKIAAILLRFQHQQDHVLK